LRIIIAASNFMPIRVASFVVLIALSLAGAGCDYVKDKLSPTSPTSPAPNGPPAAGVAISYSAIGASDALGIGGSVSCPIFVSCENGTGYVQVLTREMRTQSHEVALINLGIPAAVLSPTIYQLARSKGRDVPANFIDHELSFLAPGSTLVTVFGGANDGNALGYALQQGAAGTTDLNTYIDSQIAAFGADYDRLIAGIKSRADKAFITVINVPNLAALPYAAGYPLQERQALQRIAVGFNRHANRQAGNGVVVLDVMCDANAYSSSRISSDGFHPNDAGYAYMAQRLLAIVNGAASTPAASCSQMTVVP
jgi:lysophospholipase L1-like esterase